jgi:hypothetical protein
VSHIPVLVRDLVDRRLDALSAYSVFLDGCAPAGEFGGTPAIQAIVREWTADRDEAPNSDDYLCVGFAIGVELGRRLGGAR